MINLEEFCAQCTTINLSCSFEGEKNITFDFNFQLIGFATITTVPALPYFLSWSSTTLYVGPTSPWLSPNTSIHTGLAVWGDALMNVCEKNKVTVQRNKLCTETPREAMNAKSMTSY